MDNSFVHLLMQEQSGNDVKGKEVKVAEKKIKARRPTRKEKIGKTTAKMQQNSLKIY